MGPLYIYLSVFGLFFIIGVPVVLSLAISSIVLLISSNIGLTVFAQQWLTSTDSYSLTAIFCFMLAGEIMNTGGLTKRVVGLASKIVGERTGGLALITGVGSMFFAAINGSAIATASAMGAIMIPAMTDENYDPEFSGAVVASGGVIGPIIPPSIPMILYATITGVSVSKLFAGGIGLGLLMGASALIISYLVSKKRNYRGSKGVGSTKGAIWAMLLPLGIMGTITFGVLTATESAALSVVYAFLVSRFAYKEISLRELPQLIQKSFISTATVMAIVGSASVAAWVLTAEQIPQAIATMIQQVVSSKTEFMLLTFVVLIIVGMVMDLTPAVLILAPVFIEPVRLFGIDPIYFGVFFVAVLVIGLITPPVGTLIYTACSMTKRSFMQVTKELMPFVISYLSIVILSIFIPQIIMFIPSLMK